MTAAYDNYEMNPAEHIKRAEHMANIAADLGVRDAQVYATLSVAHATIAMAQMKGAMRA